MSTLTVPESLFHEIQALASAQGLTVDAQAAELLSKALAEDLREIELLTEIRAERDVMAKNSVLLTDDSIRQAKEQGRK